MFPKISDTTRPKLLASCKVGDLNFAEMVYPSDFRMPIDTHDTAFLDFNLKGDIQEFWEKRTFVRGATTLIFIPAGSPHANHYREDTRSFQVELKTPWLERVQQVATFVETPTEYRNGIPTWIAAHLYREFQRPDNVTPLIMEGLMMELAAAIARQATGYPEGNRCPRWLRQAKEFLHAHFTETVSLDALAAAVGVHSSHLMRGFRQHFRCTVGDYIRQLRVEYACHLIATSDAHLSEIAYAVGFSDQSHFNRTFKTLTSMTPGEFQKISGRSASLRQKTVP